VLKAAGADDVHVVCFAKDQHALDAPQTCPKCGLTLKVRTNYGDNSKFWGCSGWRRGVEAAITRVASPSRGSAGADGGRREERPALRFPPSNRGAGIARLDDVQLKRVAAWGALLRQLQNAFILAQDLSFAKMLREDGVADRARLLSASSVKAMRTDQLTVEQRASSPVRPADYWTHHSWASAWRSSPSPDEMGLQPGAYGWDGGLGTSWRSDPKCGVVGVLLTQVGAFPGAASL
jgi:CubicO group peptidase (beta-lactamase class C family)